MEPTGPPEGTPRRPRSRVFLAVLGALVAPIIVFGVTHSAAGDAVCYWPMVARFDVSNAFCPMDKRRVSDEEATAFIDTWAATANGSQREHPLAELVDPEEVPVRQIAEAWRPVIRADFDPLPRPAPDSSSPSAVSRSPQGRQSPTRLAA